MRFIAMGHSLHQHEELLLKEPLEVSKSGERLIAALFEVGALDGEPFIGIWCHLKKAIDRTEGALNLKAVTSGTTSNPGQPAA